MTDSNARASQMGLEVGEGVLVEKMRSDFVEQWLTSNHDSQRLTAAERAEVHNMAAGMCVKDSAQASGISVETVRARRKRIYRKLNLEGAHSVMQCILALTLNKLAGR